MYRTVVRIITHCLALLICVSFLASCGSSSKAPEIQTAESLYNDALALFNEEDYFESQRLFDVLKMRFPASQYADDAQFYLAEINYKKSEYILAAFNYSNLRKTFPSSEFGKIALYKVAECYYNLSPDHYRDQEHTKMAIKSYRDFLRAYPGDSLAEQCTTKIRIMRDRMAEGDFSIAQLYIKMDAPRSALVYFDAVVNDFNDTKFYEPSFYGKIQMLNRLRRFDELKEAARLYLQRFPNGENRQLVQEVVSTIP